MHGQQNIKKHNRVIG